MRAPSDNGSTLLKEAPMKTVFIFGFLIVAAVTMSASAARANDSMARVGAGGIRLIKSEHIRMLEEVLEISTKTVSVTYRFLNESAHDIRTTVAFLMPPYHWTDGQLWWDENQKPVSTFKAFVDGRPVSTKTATKALVGGVDVTQRLRRAGLTDANIRTFAGCRGEVGEEGIVKIVSELTPNQKEMVKQLNGGKEPWPGQIGGLLLRCETGRGIRRREAKLRLPVTFCLKILPLP